MIDPGSSRRHEVDEQFFETYAKKQKNTILKIVTVSSLVGLIGGLIVGWIITHP